VKDAVDGTASDKAQGSDGFSGAFFKYCWSTIKVGVMVVINQFSSLHYSILHLLNSVNIALIPKKDGAEEITDFCTISLTPTISKLVAKMMVVRLAPHMENLVSSAQSVFLKKRDDMTIFIC
jgi:hypothetical protein